jgi:hypothetical protein
MNASRKFFGFIRASSLSFGEERGEKERRYTFVVASTNGLAHTRRE